MATLDLLKRLEKGPYGDPTFQLTSAELDQILGMIEDAVNAKLDALTLAGGQITPAPGDLNLSGGSTGWGLVQQLDGSLALQALVGSGDMVASTYDPQAIAADVFARINQTGTQALSTIAGYLTLLGGEAASNQTIAAGVITPDRAITRVETELGAASDELTNIALTNFPDGRILLIRPLTSGHAVIVKNASGGAGQIQLAGGVDFTMTATSSYLWLRATSTDWVEIGRSWGADQDGERAWLELQGSLISAGDADFTYSEATHGKVFGLTEKDQTTLRVWTFDLDQGEDGYSRGVLVNDSATEDVTVRMEDVANPGVYLSATLAARHMACLFKRADGQWIIAGKAPAELGALATLDQVAFTQVNGLAQWRILGRTSSGAGAVEAIDPSALTEEASPADGDWLLLQKTTGEFRKVQKANVSVPAATPSVNSLDATLHELLDTEREHLNVENIATAATNIVVPDTGSAGSRWHGWALTAGAVSISVARGSINGAAASSTNVTDAVWGSSSGANTTITSAGAGLPPMTAGDHFSVRNHSTAANNGIYVATGSPTTSSLPATKLTGSNPADAAAEAVDIDKHAKVTLAAGSGSEWRAAITAQAGTSAEVQLEGETAEPLALAADLDLDGHKIVGLVEALSGHIETAANKTYVLDLKAPYAYTVNSLAAKTVSGTCTAKLTIDGVDVTGITALAVSSSEDFDDASGANSVAIGNTLAMVISANSAALDLQFTVAITRA